MKKLIFTMAILGSIQASGLVFAQTIKAAKVPAAVMAALKTKYPASSGAKITWEKENADYEANWGGKSGEDMSVVFTPAGSLVEQVEAMPVSTIPAGVAKYIARYYKGAKVAEWGKVTDGKGKVSYEAEVKGKILIFDEKGTFLKVE